MQIEKANENERERGRERSHFPYPFTLKLSIIAFCFNRISNIVQLCIQTERKPRDLFTQQTLSKDKGKRVDGSLNLIRMDNDIWHSG